MGLFDHLIPAAIPPDPMNLGTTNAISRHIPAGPSLVDVLM